MNRREVFALAAAEIAARVLASVPHANATDHALKPQIKALAFDSCRCLALDPISRSLRTCFRAGAPS
jgi:hypothetical protein